MSRKSTEKTPLQYLGIALFVLALGVFVVSLSLSRYELDFEVLKTELDNDYHAQFVEKNRSAMAGKTFNTSFTFLSAFEDFMARVRADIKRDVTEVKGMTPSDKGYYDMILQDWQLEGLRYPIAKASSTGLLPGNSWLFLLLSILLGIVGALLYIFPQARFQPGIKNNHIFHSSMHNRGWLGIATGVFLIGFYVLLYFFPEHMVNWVIMVDPISQALKGEPASQWFLYGFLYTLAILVMGIRMIIKYRHNRYQMIRTGSVMFFQLCFAFLLPEIMIALNQPSMDLKNIWPLNYSFFFDYNLAKLSDSGAFGLFLLFWGILLAVAGVPILTYFYGKRWYCSWVCGCGGLAETLGDPYRHLSDKTMAAWQIERWIIHSVLVFAAAMTLIVIYSYLPLASEAGGWLNKTTFVFVASALLIAAPAYVYWRNLQAKVFSQGPMIIMWVAALGLFFALNYHHFVLENYGVRIKINRWLMIGIAATVIGGLAYLHRRRHPNVPGSKVVSMAVIFFVLIAGWQLWAYNSTGNVVASFNQFDVRTVYGFAIGSIFAGVVGTGFYPLMGNRVWCRFGCPLAAYLGLVQRLKSRFRITTNGGQCISCGNCSVYCEMGIDVRHYAQRGQDVVRSSCVGCGICSAVCPRGVLRLENASVDIDSRASELRVLHVRPEGVTLDQ